MHPRSLASLEDIAGRCAYITKSLAVKTLQDFEADETIQLAVAKSFEIIGESLLRLERSEPAVLERISDHRRIIGCRNRLVHGYDAIENDTVWEIATDYLPVLCAEVYRLLGDESGGAT